MQLHTKNGRPLEVVGEVIYSRSGKVVGRIKGEKVFATDGRYVGTLVGGRLVYRATDSACVGAPFQAGNRVGFAAVKSTPAALLGDEPNIPD
jgi:hypothetical protein